MRYAILSDIHANLEALTAVLRVCETLRADQIICLGDIVGYYANPNECASLIRQCASACVRGNHDTVAVGQREPVDFSPVATKAILWTRRQLTESSACYLQSLPILQQVDGAFAIVHAALHPRPNDELRIRNEMDARMSLEKLTEACVPQGLCFFGHMHRRAVYVQKDGAVGRANGEIVPLAAEGLYLINPGSVGQSRDKDPRASFVVYDSQTRTAEFRLVAYDRSATLDKAMAAGLIRQRSLLRRSGAWLKHRIYALWQQAG